MLLSTKSPKLFASSSLFSLNCSFLSYSASEIFSSTFGSSKTPRTSTMDEVLLSIFKTVLLGSFFKDLADAVMVL